MYKLSSQQKSAISETAVAHELAKLGFDPYRVGGKSVIDIITTQGVRIEVKASIGTPNMNDTKRWYSFNFQHTQLTAGISDFCICVALEEDGGVAFMLCMPTDYVISRDKGAIVLSRDGQVIRGSKGEDFSKYFGLGKLIEGSK